jgi:hypothetical protein
LLGFGYRPARAGGGFVRLDHAVYPFYALWRIDSALSSSDALALDALVDWTKVHDNLRKDALSAVASDSLKKLSSDGNGAATVGGMIGTALGANFLDGMIEGMVNANAAITLYQNRPSESDHSDLKWIRQVRFLSPTQFNFAIQNPDEKTSALEFVMSLEGIETQALI